MGAIASLAAYRAAQAAVERCTTIRAFSSTNLSGVTSSWRGVPAAGQGAIPSTPEAPTRATPGALGQVNAVSGDLRVVRLRTSALIGSFSFHCGIMLADRLSHMGGLDGTVTTAQTTNLPTAALTRYTSGEGVQVALEIYTAVGATQTTATCSYTNQSGTSGRTSGPVTFGGASGHQAVGRFLQFPLQQGDAGVRSVESVTVLATTGTAGNFGVTLFKPLVSVPSADASRFVVTDPLFSLGGVLPVVQPDACLFWLGRQANAQIPFMFADVDFAET